MNGNKQIGLCLVGDVSPTVDTFTFKVSDGTSDLPPPSREVYTENSGKIEHEVTNAQGDPSLLMRAWEYHFMGRRWI